LSDVAGETASVPARSDAGSPGVAAGFFGQAAPWIALALLFVVLPLIFPSGSALTMMSLMGIMIVFALSYNMLLGETGMLSFGHAVYYGLGGFFTVHAMNTVIHNHLPVPLPVMPLVGAFGGLLFGIIFGAVSTRRAGTAFAMISLGLGELVASSSLILRGFFGGEEGVSTNRTKLLRVFGLNFGPQIEVYYLIAAWCLLAMLAMYALKRTPFGRMCNAVRENAERAQFVGYNPTMVRFMAFSLAGLFAGIAGGLAAINFELVNSAAVGAEQSGLVLLAYGDPGSGRSRFLTRLLTDAANRPQGLRPRVYVLDYLGAVLDAGSATRSAEGVHEFGGVVVAAAYGPQETPDVLAALTDELTRRQVAAAAARRTPDRDGALQRPPVWLVVDDYELVQAAARPGLVSELAGLVPYAARLGLSVVIAQGANGSGARVDPLVRRILEGSPWHLQFSVESRTELLLRGTRGVPLPPGQALLVRPGHPDRLLAVLPPVPAGPPAAGVGAADADPAVARPHIRLVS